jgi:lipopolysaccharide/colanic/teichoic acid biosynthesis glycosyltransferase
MIDLKRLTDVVGAVLGLALVAPILALAAVAIRLASPGPVIYRARRAGVGGRPFIMFKLRTMQTRPGRFGGPITRVDDPRVFPLGRLLRSTKIDELPQLVNIFRGEMSLIGPRPEDPELVARYYAPLHRETLTVRPGLTSPGSLYHDTHGDQVLAAGDPEARYVEWLLPMKLALDLTYVRRASLTYDLALVWRTLVTIAGRLTGRRAYPEPPEMRDALALVVPARAAPRPAAEASAPEVTPQAVASHSVAAKGAR